MRKIIEKKWRELQPLWNELFDKNMTATPFQSYEFMTFTGKGKAYRKDLFRLVGVKELNLVLYKNNKPIAIAPLLFKRKHKKTVVYLRGHFTAANQLDFIYEYWEYEDLEFLLDSIRSLFGNVSFHLDRVSEKTVTYKYLMKYFGSGQKEQRECFSIPVTESYDEWFRGLSKSTRRSINMHYNRIERKQMKLTTKFFCGKRVDWNTCKSIMRVYADRFMIKNNFQLGSLTKVLRVLLTCFLLRDRITKWFNKTDTNFHAIVYLNDEVLAFSSGVICKDHRIILSRHAMNTKYSWYGPGGILISATIKYVTEQNECGSLNVNELDLSEGGSGGMAYKKSYGGQVHYDCIFSDKEGLKQRVNAEVVLGF